jgi:hypothetical protein
VQGILTDIGENGEKAEIALSQKFDYWEGDLEVYEQSTY